MPDIVDLILDDHETFRRRFSELDEKHADTASLGRVWEPLAALLDVHAAAEETVFYPHLLRLGKDTEEETTDAIKDHNKIRDAVSAANRAAVGTAEWWDAVGQARKENGEHMEEEEREGLADFRAKAAHELRDELGSEFVAFKDRHAAGRRLVVEDKDPDTYVADHRP